ncbi:MAG: anti-sigma factor family protein [bacterium]
MKCSQVREVLVDHIRGLLSKEESLLVEAHLKICPACREEFEEYLPMAAMLRSLSCAEAKAPKEHMESLMEIAKEYAPPLHKDDSTSVRERLLDWLRNVLHRPLIPAISLITLLFFLGSIWIALYVNRGARNSTFTLVDTIYWSSFEEKDTGGVAGLDTLPDIQFSLTVPLSVDELRALHKKIHKKQMLHFLSVIATHREEMNRDDYNTKQFYIKRLIDEMSRDSKDGYALFFRMEQKLFTIVQTTGEKKLVVRIGLKKIDKEVVLSIGRYHQ